jgi:nucleoside-diphosphate-sugar epimerase
MSRGQPETVLVSGASSQLGVFLLPRLQDAGFRILALSRKAPMAPVEVSERVHWMQPGRERGPVDYLVSCGPLELARLLVATHSSLQRVVAFSTSSVLTKIRSGNQEESQQMEKILSDEQRLGSLCAEVGIPLALLRPTLIYGCGLDRTISLMARIGRRSGFIPFASRSSGLRQPVHADDLAELAVRCLLAGTPVELVAVAGGGSLLSYREMMEATAAACGKGVRPLAINTAIMKAAAWVVSMLPGFNGVSVEMVRRQDRDMVFDDSTLRDTLSYDPRPFKPGPGDLEIPAFARALQLSR